MRRCFDEDLVFFMHAKSHFHEIKLHANVLVTATCDITYMKYFGFRD